ncbi:MAG TPA: AbrB/MazE/SpoVT family DNA-binding domain-containing protein [Candidatus Nanoarchaeia archaeon]|nr:AbrB/MazE/SpoVT family DNA-binding domain-containing protein [Candidatus Nanoarchaeia archaeon]
MPEAVDMGTVSVRGQVAIPSGIRDRMNLKEGEKIIFLLEGDALIIKKIEDISWEQVTKPLREAKKKIKEEDVSDLIHKIRKRE